MTEYKEFIIDECPHCKMEIIIYRNEMNCRIFRHGVLKINGEQMNPHASKEECEKLINENRIYGCGKPFRIDNYGKFEICDYI